MRKKLFLLIAGIIVFAFTSISPAVAVVSSGSFYGESSGAFQLDYTFGGPNIKINRTTGLTMTYLGSQCSGYEAFGYYTYDAGTGNIINQQTINFPGRNQPTYVGTFDADTRVGTWLTTSKGTFYSSDQLNTPGRRRAQLLSNSTSVPVIGFDDDRYYRRVYGDFVFATEATEPQPAGQPLPGVILSGLIGLSVVGAAKIKKRKKNL